MSFSQIDQTLLDQGKILLKKVSLIPHIQKHSYQADIVVSYDPADPASDNEIELPSMGELMCKSHSGLHLLHDNVTHAYMFKMFKYHKFVEHANARKPPLFSMEKGRLVDHEPELINMEAWNARRDRYTRIKADMDKRMHNKDTSLWDYYIKLEIALMLRQISLMDIEEKQIKLTMFAETRKWKEYEALMGKAPRERQIDIDEDQRVDVVCRIRKVRENFHNHPPLI